RPLRNGLERGMPHVRAGPVAEDKHMARVGRPNQQGGDFSLFRCGKDFHLFCFVSHLEVSTVLLTGKTWRQLLASKHAVSLIAQSSSLSNNKIRRITYFIFMATKVISSSAALPAAQSSPVCSKRSRTACGAPCALASNDSLLRS